MTVAPKRLAVLLAAALVALTLTPAHAAAPSTPGTVVSEKPGSFYLDPLATVPAPASIRHLTYLSTNQAGKPVRVTGTLMTPSAAWTGPGTRPLVTYAVGTQGMADRCAPSAQFATGQEYEGQFVNQLLAQGYAVVVTDYQGLGTPGTHAYVNSIALGHDVLDAARAAKNVRVDRVPADAPVLIAGYSEGGNAAAAALEQHRTYAPDVHLIGGYAGAVPADLPAVAPGLDGSAYVAFLGYSVIAIGDLYPQLRIRNLLNATGRKVYREANHTCLTDGLPMYAFQHTSSYTKSGLPVTAYLSRPDIAAVLESLRLGTVAPDVPVLVAHSRLDDVVPFAQDQTMVQEWCDRGAQVDFEPGVAPSHVAGAAEAFPKALAFLKDRVDGAAAHSTCSGS